MNAIRENSLPQGQFFIEIGLANGADLSRSKAGGIPRDQVRRMRADCVVGRKASRLTVSEAMVRQLGLTTCGTTLVRYAVEPGNRPAIIGDIVLWDLDLSVDSVNHRHVPRDPQGIVVEV